MRKMWCLTEQGVPRLEGLTGDSGSFCLVTLPPLACPTYLQCLKMTFYQLRSQPSAPRTPPSSSGCLGEAPHRLVPCGPCPALLCQCLVAVQLGPDVASSSSCLTASGRSPQPLSRRFFRHMSHSSLWCETTQIQKEVSQWPP